MAGKEGECSAELSEFHFISSQDEKEEKEEEPTFIEQPPDRLNCLICHCVMKEPHIVTCCCNKMCRDCIQRVHLSGQPCPNCREPNFSIFLEKRLNSEILDLKVRCTYHRNGCEWVGELRDLKKHTNPVNGSCRFVKVKCPFGCSVAYLRKDTINHESVCTNLPPEKQIKKITDQFKGELQAMLSQFQDLYKSETARVEELTILKENLKKEQQEMKNQFEAEKKQLLEESKQVKQQIALLTKSLKAEFTQQMKIKNEEHQQQMMQLQKEFEKKEKERSEAVKNQLAKLEEKEKQMEIQHQKQLIDIKDKLSTESKELYQDEHKQRMEESKEESKNIHYSRTLTGLSKVVLLLMHKVREDCSKNMQFFPEEGKVIILASSEEELEQCITQFQNTYQEIITNRQLKSGSLEIPPSFQMENMSDLLQEFDGKYNQCHFSYDEKARVVKIISISSRQFDQARKLLGDRLAGEKWEEKKEEKGGGGKAAGATGIKISTKTGSSEVLSITEGRKLTVKRSNLVEEDVDAIVNAANSKLDHAGGVAGALNKASNGELQRASNTYIRNYGQVPVGGAAVTSAGGKLKCKRVIHAVGPTASRQMTDFQCSQLIYQAITNSLIEGDKMKATSISFPALSTGIFSVDKSLAAEAIFQAILNFRYTNSKILKDIRIVILDEDTYSVFSQHLVATKIQPTKMELPPLMKPRY